MPRRNSGPRLWLRPAEQGKAGGIERLPQWHIKDDGGIRRPIGCFARDVRGLEAEARQQAVAFNESEHARAQQALAQYIVAKHRPTIQKGRGASDVSVLDVLLLWGERVVPTLATAAKTAQRLVQLGEFWAGKTLADVDGDSVDAYVEWRCKQAWKSARPDETGNPARMVKPQGARRELEDLRAAINWHRGRGYHREVIEVPLPPKGRPKETHLERHEAARLLLQMWRCREMMTVRRNTPRAGEKVASRKRPQVHLTRFTLLGIYTGTRAGAIATAAFDRIEGRSWLDLDTGMFHRLAVGKAKSNKRQPPVRLPDRLLAHIRRWKRLGFSKEFVVEFNGQPVVQVNKGFGVALEAAGLQGSPHMLRHTCATWLLQRGVRSWDAANYLGMSERILLETYGHWAADFQAGITGGRRRARPEAELHDVFSTYYNREVDLTIARRARAARLARRVSMGSNAA